ARRWGSPVLACCVLWQLAGTAVAQQTHVFSAADVLGFEQPARALISPDGRQLLYENIRRDPVSDTRVTTLQLAPQLRAFVPLANTAGCMLAAWSPDSTRLAFVCERDGANQLIVRNLSTGTDRQIASNTIISAPAWSPDGAQLAFQQFVPTD